MHKLCYIELSATAVTMFWEIVHYCKKNTTGFNLVLQIVWGETEDTFDVHSH